jgi:uncharacterized protein YdaU (DUF1376 family)
MNYYPFHIGDYASATRHLSWDEDAAYRRLLDVYYTTEKPLPVDLRAVCRLVMATTEAQREAVAIVLDEFFVATDAGWINVRADEEIAAMREKQQKQRDKANARWQKQRAEPGNPPAMPRHGDSDAAASKTDADAMPPTPTPTPTPTPRGKNKARSALPDKPAGVSDPLWDDFIALRKAKQSPLTQTALDAIAAEAGRAGMTVADAMRECCARGWRGFKAEWVADKGGGRKAGAGKDVFAEFLGEPIDDGRTINA